MKTLMMSTAIATSLALAGMAQAEPIPVEKISVDVDMNAVENAAAAGVWASLSKDLEAAILERVSSQVTDDPEAAEIKIDIDEVSLATNFAAAMGADSHLSGTVEITDSTVAKSEEYDNNLAFYQLDVTAEQLRAYYPDGTDVAVVVPNSDIYYTAMVQAFADNVADKLK